MNEYHYLEIESVVTAGDVSNSEAQTQMLEDKIERLSLRKQQSERARIGFNNLLKCQRVLSRCSFGLVLIAEQTGYQRFEHGPHIVELVARLLEFNVPIETGENGTSAEIVVSATYDTIGGTNVKTPKHLPMILGHWYGLGGGGNSRTYLSHVTRLTKSDNIPTISTINYQRSYTRTPNAANERSVIERSSTFRRIALTVRRQTRDNNVMHTKPDLRVL